jgi:transposase
LNHLGIDVGKRKCRAALKDDRGRILDEFFFGNSYQGILELIKRIQDHGTKKCNAVLESTGNMWMRVHDTLEDNGIDTILANTYKTKIIAHKQR